MTTEVMEVPDIAVAKADAGVKPDSVSTSVSFITFSIHNK